MGTPTLEEMYEYRRRHAAETKAKNEEYAKKAAVRNGLDKYYTDYKEMLKDGGFDCVIVCTPSLNRTFEHLDGEVDGSRGCREGSARLYVIHIAYCS